MAMSERLEIEIPADLAAYVHACDEEGGSATDSDIVRDLLWEAEQRDRLHGNGRRKIATSALAPDRL